MILVFLKTALTLAIGGSAVFIAVYTWITRFAAWRNRIGLTIQLEATFLILSLAPILAAVVFMFKGMDAQAATWALIVFLSLTGIVMIWRAAVFWSYRDDVNDQHRRPARHRSGGQEP